MPVSSGDVIEAAALEFALSWAIVNGVGSKTGRSSRRCCGSCAPGAVRDLPEDFGPWNSVFRRFSRKGIWWRIFEALSADPDFEYLIVDSTIVRAHQHASGAKKGGLKIRPSAVPAAA